MRGQDEGQWTIGHSLKLDACNELAALELAWESVRAPLQVVDLRPTLFDRQRAVWDDDSKIKLLLGSRRNGKSVLGASWLLDGAQRVGGFLFPYIAQSRKNAKLIVWEELKRICRTSGLQVQLNESDLTARLPNRSTVLLGGCKDRSQVQRWYGLRCGRVVIDECQTMPWLEELMETVRPSLLDVAGSMMLAGNPGMSWSGLWYEITGPGRASQWPLYHWTLFENPTITAAHDEAIRYKTERGWSDDDPTWQRLYLGRWAHDEESLVFPWKPEQSRPALPRDSGWHYTLGVDVGQVDECAFVLWASHVNERQEHVVMSRKESGMLVDQVCTEIRQIVSSNKPCTVVIDTGGMGKQHAEELRRRYAIPVKAADKRDKASAIIVLRDRIRAGLVSVLHGAQNDAIRDEWSTVAWNDDRTDLADGQSDHASHAALYGHRHMRSYLYREEVTPTEADLIRERQERRYADTSTPRWDR